MRWLDPQKRYVGKAVCRQLAKDGKPTMLISREPSLNIYDLDSSSKAEGGSKFGESEAKKSSKLHSRRGTSLVPLPSPGTKFGFHPGNRSSSSGKTMLSSAVSLSFGSLSLSLSSWEHRKKQSHPYPSQFRPQQTPEDELGIDDTLMPYESAS